MSETAKNIRLTNSEISAIISDMGIWMQEMQIERKNALRLNLSMEEILLRWQEHFGDDTLVTVTIKRKFGNLIISMSLKSEEWNPLETEYGEQDFHIKLLESLGLGPSYSYKKGVNYVTLKLNRQRSNSVVNLLITILAAVILGGLGLKFTPELANNILNQAILPIRTTLLNLLTAVAVPVVFFSVFQGMIGVGDVAGFGKIGKRLMIRFILKIAVFTALAGFLMFPFFSITFLGSDGITNFGGALKMILDIFPDTFLEPFTSGNALQAIVIAIALGLAVLILDSRADSIKKASGQLSSALYMIMEWVSKTIPALVFLLILETVWSGNIGSLLGLWKPMLVIAVVCVLMIFIELMTVVIKFKVSPAVLIKKMLPSVLIAFATSCAMATYSVTTETCKKDLGLDKKIIDFGIPIGMVVYMPAISVYYLMILFYGLEQYRLSCSWDWILIAWITASLLSIATPPVSGGSMACFAVLLHQMGIPSGAIAFALAMNVIAERFCTVANLSMIELEIILTADKTNLLDSDVLRKSKKKKSKYCTSDK